ncbi:MAG: transglycosylase domain-containing protein, partial [Anaerolineales bacterium]|nr:transglycosylase domain-containing protein [Anaerolineales bacterium]
MRRWLLLFVLLVVVGGTAVLISTFSNLPAPGDIAQRLVPPSVRIVDRNGRLLYDVLDAEYGRHTNLPLAQIPLALQQATIATEDRNFYTNPGVDVQGILRAFWINLRGGEVLAGGSTLTQQVARNLLLGADERAERTARRKLRESWLAWRVARELPKDDVLALYLNQMNYGALAYGVEAAAQTYFAKSATELTLAESALIAGLTQAPALYNPFTDPDAAKARQLVVLDLMQKADFITADELELAARQPLAYAAAPYPVNAPHFVMMVQSELDALFTPQQLYESGGLTVRTTLDLDWQQHAETILAEQLTRLNHPDDGGPGHNAHNGALVAINPHNGEVLALLGSPDYFDESISGAINMALQPRQPGSALKPLIYAAALAPDAAPDWTAATMLPDVRTVFTTNEGDSYVPINFSRDEHGPVLLRTALASSLNIPAVLTLDAVGVDEAVAFAQKVGIGTLADPDEYDLSFALGGGAVRLLDLTAVYGAFANGGYRVTPQLILDVTDAAGEMVVTAVPPDQPQVIDPRVAWLISDILSDDEARQLGFGRNSLLNIDRTAAAKTGTTNDYRDNWTIGFTRNLVVGVWAGNADGKVMKEITGVTGAAPIWHNFMEGVLNNATFLHVLDSPTDAKGWNFTAPDDVVLLKACPPRLNCRGDGTEYFSKEWVKLAGVGGPLADSFERQPTVPVYVNSYGGFWPIFCTQSGGEVRNVLRLSNQMGLPGWQPRNAVQTVNTLDAPTIPLINSLSAIRADDGRYLVTFYPENELERMRQLRWARTYGMAVSVG